MSIVTAVEVGQLVELTRSVVGIERAGGRMVLVAQSNGPPNRIDGHTLGVVGIDDGPPPHDGEMHPDGDELLYLISGRIEVRLELGDGDHDIELAPGQALVVPQGTWHQISHVEDGQLLHITPGPNGQSRPRPAV